MLTNCKVNKYLNCILFAHVRSICGKRSAPQQQQLSSAQLGLASLLSHKLKKAKRGSLLVILTADSAERSMYRCVVCTRGYGCIMINDKKTKRNSSNNKSLSKATRLRLRLRPRLLLFVFVVSNENV